MVAVSAMRRKKNSEGIVKGRYSYMCGNGDESGLLVCIKCRRRLHFACVSEYCD